MNNEEKILKVLETLVNRFDHLENRFDLLESQVSENTQILKALEHKVDVVKAVCSKNMNDIAHLKLIK